MGERVQTSWDLRERLQMFSHLRKEEAEGVEERDTDPTTPVSHWLRNFPGG